jgi:phosphatidylserine/phosphatidylglycerophosphate/cardiolipin synthase-like enzyme
VRNADTDHGLTLAVYAGTTGVQLAWDADEALRENLLGFAIKRFGGSHPEGAWLQGGIGFPAQRHPPGKFLDTHLAPIQAFRWGDYTVRPATEYRYELIPMYAPWDGLRQGDSVSVTVTTETVDVPPHSIAFNRAVAASQAYSRRFGDDDPHDNADARAWLGRGLDDFIDGFIARAGNGDALDVVIYEYELEAIREALVAAAARGASVRIVYHAKEHDEQTPVNTENIGADRWPQVDLRPRLTAAICHDKSVVLSRLRNGERQPEAVLTGSTNWTFNGLYYQGNVSHVVSDPEVARRYLAVFEQLFAGATQADMRTWLAGNDPVPDPTDDAPLQLLFSPRPDRSDLDYYVALIGQAKRSLIFATAFDLDGAVLAALAGEGGARRILRYGLQNSASRVTGYNRDLARDFTATGRLTSAPDQFLREHTPGQRGGILIHSKIILVDFDTQHPTLVSGSANYSHGSSHDNDENTIVVRNDTRVADLYLTELFRLFDHYRFRYNWAHPPATPEEEGGGTEARRAVLDDTPGWTDRYYADPTDPHALERQQLSRPLTNEGPPA